MDNQNLMQAEVPIQPANQSSRLPIFLGFLVLFLLFASSFLAYQNMQLKKQLVSLQTIATSTPTPIVNQEVKSSVLQTFTDSLGKTKYVLYKIADENSDAYYSYDIYLASQSSLSDEAIKLFTGVNNIGGIPLISSNKDNVSSNSGKKYLMFDHTVGDNTEFWLFSEDGKNIKVDFSKMGLGTTIPGMYSLGFNNWISNTTKFKIIALTGNDKTYEATFDATTGFQIGDTIEIGN